MRATLRPAAVLLLPLCALVACRTREDKVADLVADLRSKNPSVSDQAVRQFVMMGEPAVPVLIPMLKDPETRVRSAAASALWGLGPAKRAAVPALAEALADADDGVRLNVAMALESTGPAAAPAVPALARAVRDRDGNVRLWAAKALTRIGPAAREALPALEQASRYDSTRPAAEEAIRAIKGPSP
jgi:HEAT repeat protein